jgi:hypothetical protein
MATVTVTPATVVLATVGAFADVTLTVAGLPAGSPAVDANATFPVTIEGVVVNGTLNLEWPAVAAPVPSHGTPTLAAALVGKVTLARTSLSADGTTAVYRATRNA